MKKKLILFLGFFIISIIITPSLWSAPALFKNYTHYFSYDDFFTTGGRADFSLAELRASSNFQTYNFGISLFSDNYLKHFPCILKIGNLSIGGFYSKLKDPVLDTSVDGYTSCYSAPSLITAQLPAYSLFSKPISYYLQLAYNNDEKLINNFSLNSSYSPDENNLSLSCQIKLNFSNKLILTNASGISLFDIEEKIPNTWYSDLPYYSSRKSCSFGNQINFNICDFFNTCFSLFFYQTPFGENGLVYKSENKGEWKNFSMGLSAFLNTTSNLITPENTILEPCTQIKANVRYNFVFPPEDKSLQTGITVYSKIPFQPPITPDLKFGISATLKIPIWTFQTTSSFSFKLPETDFHEINKVSDDFNLLSPRQLILTYFSSNFENIWDFKYFSTTLKLSSNLFFSSKPQNKSSFPLPDITSQHYAIALSLALPGDIINGSSAYSFSCKNHEISDKKLKMGITFNGKYKKVIIILKFNGEFCI